MNHASKWVIPLGLVSVMQISALTFESTLLEIRAGADEPSVTADFKFSNKGDAPVRIVRYNAACSCMNISVRDSKFEYASGESGGVRAVFSVGNYSGTVDKVAILWLKDTEERENTVRLTLRIHIPVMVSIEPKTLTWEVGGDPAPQTIRIDIDPSMEIRVLNASPSNGIFKYKLKTREEGRHYELVVTPERTGVPGLSIFRIETDCSVPRHRIQQAFAVIRNVPPSIPAGEH